MADNLVSLLWSRTSTISPGKAAFIDSATHARISYVDLRAAVAAASAGMESIGIGPGDVVLIVLPNSIEFAVIFLAALALGSTVTLANPQNTAKELHRQVVDSRARFVFSFGSIASKIQKLGLPLVLVGKPDFPLGYVSYEELLQGNSKSMAHSSRSMAKLGPAALLYSSGTTGVSKGVILSHANFMAAMDILHRSRREPVPEEEISLGVLPFFHIAGLVYLLLGSLYCGTTLVVVRKFDLVEVYETIERYKVTLMVCVPPMVIAFVKNHSVSKNYDLTSVKRMICGAAPLGKETQEEFLRLYPQVTRVVQGYGMTETTALGFGNSKDTIVGSAGKIMPDFEAKVVEVGTGRALPPGSTGELCVRGPCIMEGYLNNPEATSETIDSDGWLHTGDLGYLDADGNLYVMDRLKELIKYKGFQVAPAELEALLLSHPLIKDCAVVPFPDEQAGEVPLAYVVRVPDSSLSEDEVTRYVSEQVAPHKKVRKVRFLDAIPKSATGKLLRRELIALSRSRL